MFYRRRVEETLLGGRHRAKLDQISLKSARQIQESVVEFSRLPKLHQSRRLCIRPSSRQKKGALTVGWTAGVHQARGDRSADTNCRLGSRSGEAMLDSSSLSYGVTQDEARRYGLPCGGTMKLMVEPDPDSTALATLRSWLSQGLLVRRTVVAGEPTVALDQATRTDALSFDGKRLSTIRGPRWRLLIIGAGQIAEYLAPMAQALGYAVFVCDPRTEYSGEWRVPGAQLLTGIPDDVAIELGLDPHTAVVATTHDPKLDDLALLEALKSPAFYVGALGSRVNSERRKERLAEHFDLSGDQVERLHGPVGLPIGSHTPPEIAVAIVAEMTAVKNGMWTKAGLRNVTDQR